MVDKTRISFCGEDPMNAFDIVLAIGARLGGETRNH